MTTVKIYKCRLNRKTLNVDSKLHSRVKDLAERNGKPIQHIVEEALNLYLIMHEPKTIRIKRKRKHEQI